MEPKIFQGLKVIDCASFIAAPAAATVFSDFGADVIKIEPPGPGDPYRALTSMPGYPISKHNYAWVLDGRNKKSLALDLSKLEGQKVLYRLVSEADVFITNYPLDVRERLGVTYQHLAPLSPHLIYASFTGYGEVGEEANKPGFDSNAWWGRSGLMDLVRPDMSGPPARSLPGMGDHPSAISLFAAIAVALYRRERTGAGAQVGTSLLANGIWANGCYVQAKLCGAEIKERPPRDKGLNALANSYRCRDGRWLILSLLNEEKQWPILAKCVGREDLVADVRFATKQDRYARSQELIAILDKAFAKNDLAGWRMILDSAGLVFGVVATMDDMPNDKQMLANEVLVPFDCGDMLTVNSPFWIEGMKKVTPRHAPAVGEHTDQVLYAAGYGKEEIERLKSIGVVF